MLLFKNTYIVFAVCFFLIATHKSVLSQSIGYDTIFLGLRYDRVKDILHYHDYNYREIKMDVVKVITWDSADSHGMLFFDYFDRLYTLIVTIPVTEVQYEQLHKHLVHKYGEFKLNNNIYCCTTGLYRIALYYNKTAKTATVEYGHTIPLLHPRKVQYSPYSKF